MNIEKIKKAVLKFLFPDYDELTLFLFSLVTLLFVISSSGSLFRLLRLALIQDSFFDIIMSFLFILVALAVIFLPVFHAFSKRKKRKWEKKVMLFAIVFIDYLVAWNVYDHLKGEFDTWLIIFPLINAVQASLVAIGLWYNLITSEKISDEDADSTEIIISSILLMALFLVFHLILHQYWAITFSVCVFYATIINKIVLQAYRAIKKIIMF